MDVGIGTVEALLSSIRLTLCLRGDRAILTSKESMLIQQSVAAGIVPKTALRRSAHEGIGRFGKQMHAEHLRTGRLSDLASLEALSYAAAHGWISPTALEELERHAEFRGYVWRARGLCTRVTGQLIRGDT
jgi:hypothetical protein